MVGKEIRRWVLAVSVTAVLLTGCAGGTGAVAGGNPGPAPATATDAGGATADQSSAALAFSGTTLTGTTLDASTLAGQPVVLWFWAPWCTICRAEAPDVAAVAAEFKGSVTFLGIPGRGPEADMQAFVDQTGTTGFEHVVDADGALWQYFGVISQPSFVFVDSAGTASSFAGSLPADALRQAASDLVSG